MLPSDRTVDLAPLTLRAAVSSVNDDARTAELIFSTGAPVERTDWRSGTRYRERLSLTPAHVRLDRLNGGAPLLDAHAAFTVANQIGVIVEGSATVTTKDARATVRFSERAEVEPIWQDVRTGIVRNVSVGYRVHRCEETAGTDGALPTRLATDWEPFELSLVPMGADPGARVRQTDLFDETNPCVVVTRAAKEPDMPPKKTSDTSPANAGQARSAATATDPPPPAAAPSSDVAAARRDAADAERTRAAAIRTAVRAGGLEETVADTLIDQGVTADAARATILDTLATRQAQTDTRTGDGRVQLGDDARDQFVRAAHAWLLQRAGGLARVAAHDGTPVADYDPGECRGMTLIDLGRACLTRAGQAIRGLDRMQLAERMLTVRSGASQTTSDFAVLLETVLHKILRAEYALQADTWSRWCGIETVSDFRAHHFYRLGSLTALDALSEHGEFTNKAIPDAEKASFSVGTTGNILAVTRETIVNDDLGGLTRLARMLGRAGKLSIEQAAYAALAEHDGLGPSQADGEPLFHAHRANVGTDAALSAAAIDADATILAQQKDPNGVDFIDLQPDLLLVPRGLRGTAVTINEAQYDPDTPNKLQKPNAVRGLFRDIVATPRLTGTRRYLFASPALAPVVVVSFLEGQQEPVLETRDGWRVDGVEMRARLDFGVDVVDYRGAVTNAGM